jgi:multiple sugar transport system substrate-binding protein
MAMKKVNKKAFILSVLMILSLLLSACGEPPSSSGNESSAPSSSEKTSSEKSADDVKTFTFVAAQYSNATQPFLEKVVKDFEAANPGIKVDLQVVGWDALEQKVNTMISTNQAPDLLNLNHYAGFVADDLLYSMDEVLPKGLKDKFIGSFYTSGEVDGVTYGLPYLASIRALFYNKDIFAQAGITKPPSTWSELVTVAKQIKDKTGVDGFGVPMTTLEGQAYMSYFMWGNGGDWKRDGKWTLNLPENVEGVQFLSDLVNKEKVTNPKPTAIHRDDMHKVFGAGKIGMMISANFLPTILKKDAPNLNYDIAPIPVADGKKPINLGVADYLMVFKSSKHPEAVGKFLEFFYEDARYEAYMNEEGMLPVTQGAADSMAAKSELHKALIGQLPIAKFYPNTDPAFPEVRLEAIKAMQEIILGVKPAQNALDDLQKKFE